MNNERLIKSNQEQAVGAWINYLNQERLNRLTYALVQQEENLMTALKTVDTAFETIKDSIIDRNRGGYKGMHGFIAEIAECGIGNAREQIKGNQANYMWVDDNGPVDLVRNGVDIQQKFVNAGNHLSLKAISEHLTKYPDYIESGGLYQIPEDHYDQIVHLVEMPKEVADKMPTSDGSFSLKQWKEVQQFFGNDQIPLEKIEPSKLSYDSVQANKIEETLSGEKNNLRNTSETNKELAYEESLPTLAEGAKATALSGAIEGGSVLCMSIVKKRKSGKRIKDFNKEDWNEIAEDTGKASIKGSVRGATIYTLSNYTATPTAVASSIVTASFGVAEQVHLYRTNSLSESELIENSELLCLDASVSALSSFIGQAIIPIPVLGAVIGNTVGTIMYNIGKDKFTHYEQELIRSYLNSQQELDEKLNEDYKELVALLGKDIEIYLELLENAFSPDVSLAFEGSVRLAEYVGVPHEEILDTKEKVQSYFLD